MVKLSFVGDLTVDIYPQLNKIHLAGSSLNCSVWAKKLGAEPTILAAVGNDEAGRQYKEFFKRKNFSLKFLKTLKFPTSNIEIFLDKNGERSWGNWDPGVLAKYHLEKRDFDFLKTCDAVAMPVYAKTKHLLSELLSLRFSPKPPIPPKPLIVIDFDDLSQFGKDTKIIEDHLPYIDIVFAGLDMVKDAKIIRKLQDLSCHCEEKNNFLLSLRGPRFNRRTKQSSQSEEIATPLATLVARNDEIEKKLFIITLNKNGSLAFLGNQVFQQKADKVKVVDSTGGGDAFLAGFLVEYLKSQNTQNSLKKGTEIATQAIQQIGAY